ncbi:MAG: hypothetical protein ACM3PU_16155 [Gemmatimonadota bacterium]
MKRLLPTVIGLSFIAGSTALAQPIDKPPALKDGPRVEAKGPDAESTAPLAEPDATDLLPPKVRTEREARIEQRRQHGHVVEIVVTPAGRAYSYTIENREGQRPLSPQELSSGLSTPRFLKFEF